MIKRAHPHSVVIIENKSNFAIDQPNQLYRYWYQEIYLKQKARFSLPSEINHPPTTRYQIIYLSPAVWKQPDIQSLSKPTSWKWAADLPAVVPIEIKQYVFQDFVLQWLEKTLDDIPPNNHRLREFTKQYIQFWQFN